jgi:hypothetical protein
MVCTITETSTKNCGLRTPRFVQKVRIRIELPIPSDCHLDAICANLQNNLKKVYTCAIWCQDKMTQISSQENGEEYMSLELQMHLEKQLLIANIKRKIRTFISKCFKSELTEAGYRAFIREFRLRALRVDVVSISGSRCPRIDKGIWADRLCNYKTDGVVHLGGLPAQACGNIVEAPTAVASGWPGLGLPTTPSYTPPSTISAVPALPSAYSPPTLDSSVRNVRVDNSPPSQSRPALCKH